MYVKQLIRTNVYNYFEILLQHPDGMAVHTILVRLSRTNGGSDLARLRLGNFEILFNARYYVQLVVTWRTRSVYADFQPKDAYIVSK